MVIGYSIARVGATDVSDLLPLMRGYCDFYHAAPNDEDLIALATALVEDPDHEGVQLIARDAAGHGIGIRHGLLDVVDYQCHADRCHERPVRCRERPRAGFGS